MKMIVPNQKIKVKWSNPIKNYYESIVDENGNQKYFYKKGEFVLIDLNDINQGSKFLIKCICSFCGKETEKKAVEAFRSERHFCDSECKFAYQRNFGSFNKTRELYNCDYCSEEIEVKQYVLRDLKEGKRKHIFCSNKCKAKWESKNKIGLNNPNYNQINKVCEYCGKHYTVPQNQNDRTHYCSVECRQKGQRNRTKLECANCSEEIYRNPTQIKNNKSGFFYCSQKCANEHRSKISREIRHCEYCKEEFECKKSEKLRFCSMECQSKWQSETLVGENAVGFNHDIPLKDRYVNCDWCGKLTLAKPKKLKQIKENSAKHFCSVECKNEWFTKEWSQQEEWKLESAERAVKMLEDGVFGHTDTEPQLIINKFLDELNIRYENEYNCKYVSIDNYLLDFNLMIEVMGTYWHSDPRIYKEINYQNQVDRIKNDKIKKTYIKNNYNINILYLWEDDIKNNIQLCKELINKYISNDGRLLDYNSFNYSFSESLKTNDEIIIPYMDYEIEELRPFINITESKRRSMKQPDKWITFNCEQCGEEKEMLITHYNKATHHFCSQDCAHEFKKGKSRDFWSSN
jgi:YHS domain-containing protein